MQELHKKSDVSGERGRWFLVAAGLIIMLCLGAIYAYSIIAVPLKKVFEAELPQGYGLKVSSTEMQIPFIVFLFVFASTMSLAGKYLEKYGPRKMALLGAVFVGLGWFLASYATSPLALVLLYGVIGGLGVGIAYNCPIVTSARWFPDRRGLAVGLTVLGFGLSAALIGPIANFLVANLSFRYVPNSRSHILHFNDHFCIIPAISASRLETKKMGTSRNKN